MRIFCSFWNGSRDPRDLLKLPHYYEGLLNGLRDEGNQVLYYCPPFWCAEYSSDAPQSLLDAIRAFDPELIILFNNLFYNFDFSKNFSCPTLVWEVDSPLYYTNKHILKNNPRIFYAVASSTSIDVVADMFGAERRQILHLPFFTSVQREEREKSINISFIGTRFTTTDIVRNFLAKSPSQDDRKQFDKALAYVSIYPFGRKEDIEKCCGITSQTVLEAFDYEKACALLSSSRRTDTLGAIADLGLSLYGSPTWAELEHPARVALSYHDTRVYSIQHNQDIYNASKISLSVSHVQATSGFPWRVMDIMASSACLVSDYHSDFEKIFPKAPIPCFSSPFEAREICLRLLRNDNERNDIVAACNEHITDDFRVPHVIDTVGAFIGMRLAGKGGHIQAVAMPSIVQPQLPKKTSPLVQSQQTSKEVPSSSSSSSSSVFFRLLKKNFRGKRRLKLIIFCMLLVAAQLPLLSRFFSYSRRAWLLERITINTV